MTINRQSREYVRWYQDALNRIDGAGLSVDGIAGARTRAAVRRYQTRKGLVVDGNWLDGGHCTSKFEEMNGFNLVAQVTNNKFGPNRDVSSCKIAATAGTELTDESGNTMEATGEPVTVYRASTS